MIETIIFSSVCIYYFLKFFKRTREENRRRYAEWCYIEKDNEFKQVLWR